MKRTKLFMTCLLSLLLLVALSALVFAEDATVVESGTCGENLTWTLDSDGVLRIRGTGYMSEFKDYKAPWFEMRESINTVVIEDGVTSISKHAFSAFDSLTYVQIGDGLTSIGPFSFAECGNLKKVILGQSVTDINVHAFYKCYELEEINLPDSLDTIRYDAFHFCTSLTSIQLPKSSHNLYIWRYAFGRTAIEELYIPSNVRWSTSDEHTFYGSPNLKRVIIERGVENIPYYCFDSCPNLQDVYYEGTKEEWNQIYIASGNGPLNNATKHYNYATSHFPAGYDVKRDTWHFENPENRPNKRMYSWFMSDEAKEALDNDLMELENGQNGLCFGMATTTAILNTRVFQSPGDFEHQYVSEIEKEDFSSSLSLSALNYLGYMQALVIHPSVVEEINNSTDNLNAIYQAIKAYQDRDPDQTKELTSAVVLALSGRYFGEAHHAVLAIKAIDESDCAKILVYDPNHPGEDRYVTFQKNEQGDFISWTYTFSDGLFGVGKTEWGTGHKGAKIGCFTKADTFFAALCMQFHGGALLTDEELELYNGENSLIKTSSASISKNTKASKIDFFGFTKQRIDDGDPEDDAFIDPSLPNWYWTKEKQVDFLIEDVDASVKMFGQHSSAFVNSITGTHVSMRVDDEQNEISANPDIDSSFSFGFSKTDSENNRVVVTLSGIASSGSVNATQTDAGIIVTGLNDMIITYSVNDEVVAETTANITDGREVIVQVNEETEQLHVEHEHNYTIQVVKDPTCTTDGETTYTCSICGDTYTEPIPATGNHEDADNDGYCDTCEQQMTGGDHCKYCGKIHDGFFGWLVKFFHSIFAIFKR